MRLSLRALFAALVMSIAIPVVVLPLMAQDARSLAVSPPRSYADRVEIRRTAYGIPHLQAEDLGALGYAMA